VRIGVKLPHTGRIDPSSIPSRARDLEAAGFDSLWVSDHVVLPTVVRSAYPFSSDGSVTWPTDQPWVETIVTLAAAAAATSRARIGSGVLVAPQRNPVLLAKQTASLASLSDGRLDLGVGAGWLREEFEVLGSEFDNRGPRLEEWIGLLRSCWTGRPAPSEGPTYRLPPDVLMMPPPPPVPLLVGGHSRAALRRAGQLGDGWLGQQSALAFDSAALARETAVVRAAATAAGRDGAASRTVLRIVDSADHAEAVADALASLSGAGVTEVVVDVDPFAGDPQATHALLREAALAADSGAR